MNAQLNLEKLQTRTLSVLSLSNGLGAIGITIGVATASLLAKEVSGSEAFAGLAQTAQTVGAALAAYGLAQIMDRYGRRIGLSLGLLLGGLGSALMVVAAGVGSMSLLLFGAVFLGSASASGLAARYAATDLADESKRARSLSIVVWMSTIGAVLGPNLSDRAQVLGSWLAVPPLAGSFALGAVCLFIGAAVSWWWLRPDPLLVIRAHAEAAPDRLVAAQPKLGSAWSRTALLLRQSRSLAAAVLALAAAHTVMVSVMVMTPLHMAHGGATLRVIGLVISGHILGMFAFAPVVGWACDKVGKAPVLGLGAGCLLAATALAGLSPEGHSPFIATGLFLLGLGWSLATVAASALIVDLTPVSARTDVQGVSDLFMQAAAAAGAGASGAIVGAAGFPRLALFAAVVALGVLVAAAAVRVRPNPYEAVTKPSG